MAINNISPKKGKVVDIPDVPTIGTATEGASSATVAFTAATKGGPVTTYTALSSPGSFTGTGSSSPVTVTGLTNGTSYTFTVRANNATGSSPYSSASNAAVPNGPVAGYKVWLDASDTTTITSSGGSVSQWTDKSANAYTFTQATSTNQPTTGTRTINSKNVLDFDGTSDYLYSTAAISTWKFLHSAASTIFIVANTDVTNSNHSFVSTQAGSTSRIGFYTYQDMGNMYARVDKGSAGNTVYNSTYALAYGTGNYYFTYKSDPTNATAADRIKISQNGGTYYGTNTATNAVSTADSENSLTIGCLLDLFNGVRYPGGWHNGTIAEIIIYDSALSSGDIASVQSYLATKWSI
jgi:hypothetical protein